MLNPKVVENIWMIDRSLGRKTFNVRGRQKLRPKTIEKAPFKKVIILTRTFTPIFFVPTNRSSETLFQAHLCLKPKFLLGF